jgi:hypothetical protein
MYSDVGFQIITAVSVKEVIFWHITPYSLVSIYQCFFGGAYSTFLLLLADYLLRLIFYREDGGSSV